MKKTKKRDYLEIGINLILFPAVIVWHGDNGQYDVDEVKRTEEDDDDEEEHLIGSVRSYDLGNSLKVV